MDRNTKIKQSVYQKRSPVKDSPGEDLYKKLAVEGCEDFYNYIDWLDLAQSTNIIILPVTGSFFYIPEDMDNTETVINLKPLNRVKKLNGFLQKIYSFVPDYSYFTGCFEESRNGNEPPYENNKNGQVIEENKENGNKKEKRKSEYWFNNIIKRIFSSGLKYHLTRKEATSLLERAGFKLHDITVLNDRTFFCAQKRPDSQS